ncbi:hypothetical protein [Nitrosomonas sp. Nm132]|uniref:hypothetical protein n=1 Tax=Nitrosomonas sp. Nm132 TaxID=1881053 RepID=UPI00088F3081|nr:hypothetical protein [Nitrosomonas sp. Nm132]SDH26101.1 hypothetical protein SAMN05428952_100933 [Nitrosomonas sp. Nm132]
MQQVRKKPVKEKIFFRVAKGALVPADSYAQERLRARKYHVNDVVAVSISKLRSLGFNRLVHRIGQLVVANIHDFHGMDAHDALKKMQLEGNIACDEMMVDFGEGEVKYRIPRSLSFESMEEGEFRQVAVKFCEYIANRYWPDLDPEQIEHMAQSFVEAA